MKEKEQKLRLQDLVIIRITKTNICLESLNQNNTAKIQLSRTTHRHIGRIGEFNMGDIECSCDVEIRKIPMYNIYTIYLIET